MKDLSPRTYRRIYYKLRREAKTLRRLADVMSTHGCDWSIASWSKYQRGLLDLSWKARTALRKYDGRPDAPIDTKDLLEAVQTITKVSDEPDTAILVGTSTHSITVHQNGVNRDSKCAVRVRVTSVTSTRKRRKRKTLSVSHSTGMTLLEDKEKRGETWDEYVTRLKKDRDLLGLLLDELKRRSESGLYKEVVTVLPKWAYDCFPTEFKMSSKRNQEQRE